MGHTNGSNKLSIFDFLRCRKLCKKSVDKRRFRHCIEVGKMLNRLERNENRYLCLTLGIFHDITKSFSYKENIEFLENSNFEFIDGEKEKAEILHGPVASIKFSNMYPNLDKKYALAIRYHSVLKENLDRIILDLYIADKIDKTRTFITDEFREAIINEKNVEKRVLKVLDLQDAYFKKNEIKMLPTTKEYYTFLKAKYG